LIALAIQRCGNNICSWWNLHTTRKCICQQNKSPYEIILGYKPKALPEAQIKSTVEGVKERLNDLMKMRKEVLAAHELVQQKMRERITHKFEGFNKGDLVWLKGTNLKIGYPTKKLAPK
jgi:hypothetical protein